MTRAPERWPLTAAATTALLALPASDARARRVEWSRDALVAGLKELLLRGAYRMQIEEKRFGRSSSVLIAQEAGLLPETLRRLDEAIRPHTPDEVPKVVRAARKPIAGDFNGWVVEELLGHGLIAEEETRVLGLIPRRHWKRTIAGDAWAAEAEDHLLDLESLPDIESEPDSAARVALGAGALAVMAPAALPELARLDQLRRRDGYYAEGGAVGPTHDERDEAASEGDFDPIAGAGGMLEGGDFDAAAGDIGSAFDSIDSAVSSGVDSGGGGDFGGGGGDGGGGGGDGGGGG